jgi:hypothetical protein
VSAQDRAAAWTIAFSLEPEPEFEQLHAELARSTLETTISDDGSVAAISPKPADGLTTRRVAANGVDLAANSPFPPENALIIPMGSAHAATTAVTAQTVTAGLSDE